MKVDAYNFVSARTGHGPAAAAQQLFGNAPWKPRPEPGLLAESGRSAEKARGLPIQAGSRLRALAAHRFRGRRRSATPRDERRFRRMIASRVPAPS